MRALRDPRWLAGLAVALVFAVVCVWLAQWQLDRRVARAERNAAVLENYDSEAQPLDAVLASSAAPLQAGQEWQPVVLRGRYDTGSTVLLRNRPQGGSNGFLVATPFDLRSRTTGTATTGAATTGSDTTGSAGEVTTVLLVRGWVPSGDEAGQPATVPEPPPGEVQVVARLRAAEPASSRTAPQGQAYRLDRSLLAEAGDVNGLESAYGVVATEAGTRPAGLVPVPRPDTDPGPHLAYGVQWYLFALTGIAIWVVLARRHAGEHDDGTDGGREGGSPGPDGAAATGSAERGWVYEPGR